MPNVKTVEELLAQAAKQQNEHVALSQAVQLLADVLIALLAELQAQRSKRAPRKTSRRTDHTRRSDEAPRDS
jgi:hypothetical protein